jgi:hypothetical protein
MCVMYDLRLTICYCRFGTKGGDWAMVEVLSRIATNDGFQMQHPTLMNKSWF